MAKKNTKPSKITADERRLKAFELRKQGLTLRQIAVKLKVSHVCVHQYLSEALKELVKEQAQLIEEIRALELERLDMMLQGLMPKAKKGNTFAIDRVLKIMQRRSKYLNLDTHEEKKKVTVSIALELQKARQRLKDVGSD